VPISLVRVDGDFNVIGEIDRVDGLANALIRAHQLAVAGVPVDLIDLTAGRFVALPLP
jgi:hypothetical protein